MEDHPVTLTDFEKVKAGDRFVSQNGTEANMMVGLDHGRAILTSSSVEVTKQQMEGWQYACHLTLDDLRLLSDIYNRRYRTRHESGEGG